MSNHPIPSFLLNQLREQLKLRDRLAAKIGIAVHEFERHKKFYLDQIDKSLEEDKKIHIKLEEELGLSSDKNYQIDTDKGTVKEVQ